MIKLWEIARFEVVIRLRRASTWIYAGVYAGLAYWVTAGMLVDEARKGGDIYVNAPVSVAIATVIISWLGMLITAALFGDAATRDVQTRMHPLFYTAPLGEAAYLGGRFLGTLAVNVLLLAIVPLVLILAAQPAFVDSDILGPFDPATYLRPFAFIMLPSLFAIAAILFALATLSRRALASYAGVLLLFLGSMLSEEVVAEQMGRVTLGSILDPFGFTMMSELAAYLTPEEQNVHPIGLTGMLLWNRALWSGLGLIALAVAYVRFRFTHPVPSDRRSRTAPQFADAAPERRGPVVVPSVPRMFGARTRLRQALAVTGRSLREIVLSRSFLAVAAGAVVLVLTVGAGGLTDGYGTPLWPATQYVVGLLGSFLVGTSITLLTAFYAGELVWRERDVGLSEIADAAPVPDSVLFAGRFLALVLVLALLQGMLMAAGLLLQGLQGYFAFELGLYGRVLFGLYLVDYLLFAALAMLVHVVMDHKYLGHLVVLLFYVFTVFAGRVGVEHNLLVYGADPGWVYSDVSGFGPFLGPLVWFKLYWAGWALLFAVAANLFWVRGRERGLRRRVRLAQHRSTRSTMAAAALGGVLVLTAGGFVYYNTNILNEYRTGEEAAALQAAYERRYGQFENTPQPQVTGTTLYVEIYPPRRTVEVSGTYRLENRTAAAIDSVHLFAHPDVETERVTFDRIARLVLADDALGHRIFALARPLQPGDSLALGFSVRFEPRGFANDGVNTSVVSNGTYFDHTGGRSPNNRRWLPVVGYQPGRELAGDAVRMRNGLDPRPAPSDRYDPEALRDPAGREWIDFEAVIGTDEGQIAVAPGTLRETWTENGRRYVRYATDAPVKNAFAIFSADFAVHEAQWNGVQIEIFHHPAHTWNLGRMVRSVQASLDYFTEYFGPYPHRQIRIVEFPRYASLAHAYPGTISYAEGFGFLTRVDETRHLDTPFMIVAHEVAHQWWGYQVVPAAVPGAAMLTEVLAQYGAMMVVEAAYGPEPVRRFLGQMRIEYLNRRTDRDVPLLLVSGEQNIVYRKGALAMYTLRAYLGEERLNAALRRFLAAHGAGEPPYPTARDLYAELQAATPDSLRYLLADLFEENTLWSLRTAEAHAEPTGTGAWRVTLTVDARKVRADSTAGDVEVPMDDWVEIGIFTPGEDADAAEEPLHLDLHRIRSGRQQITMTVPEKPAQAGVDPHHLLLDRDVGDNVITVND